MRTVLTLAVALQVLAPAIAASPEQTWTKTLKDRAKRDALHDRYQYVRGDTGRWNDEPILQHAPPIQRKPPKLLLDLWAVQLRKQKVMVTAGDDNWLLFQTRQLDDNDRVWVERIERRGNKFTIVANEAIWKGRYRKNFTGHDVIGVNLGKLAPGRYEVVWRVQPLVFEKFDNPTARRNRRGNWPANERTANGKPAELKLTFAVSASPK